MPASLLTAYERFDSGFSIPIRTILFEELGGGRVRGMGVLILKHAVSWLVYPTLVRRSYNKN